MCAFTHRTTRLACVLFTALTFCALSRESNGGKPKPPPTLPPIRYQIQFWDVPNPAGGKYLNGMNNLGQAVGWNVQPSGAKHGFIYDPAVNASTAVDLNDLVSPPEGWVIASATDINDHGVLVGYLEPAGSPNDPDFRGGFLLDTKAPVLTLQPLADTAWSYSVPAKVNENGDILGLFHDPDRNWGMYFYNPAIDAVPKTLGHVVTVVGMGLNNPVGNRPAQVAGCMAGANGDVAFRWTPGQDLIETFPEITRPIVSDINDTGTFCGSIYTKFPKSTLTRYPMRYNTSLEVLSAAAQDAKAINSTGDLATYTLLYHDSWGFLKPTDLIDRNDPDAALWFTGSSFDLEDLNDRDPVTNFGEVLGRLRFADGSSTFFILTPVPAP